MHASQIADLTALGGARKMRVYRVVWKGRTKDVLLPETPQIGSQVNMVIHEKEMEGYKVWSVEYTEENNIVLLRVDKD